MASWTSRDEMSSLAYIKFKSGRWAKVSTLPDWVTNNNPTYTEGRELMHDGDRWYHEREIWVGKSLKYMMKWESVAQHDIELDGMFAKIK